MGKYYNSPQARQYTSQFAPTDYGFIQGQLNQKQGRFDAANAAQASMFAEADNVTTSDEASRQYKDKLIGDLENKYTEIEDKYNGDIGAGAGEITNFISRSRKDKFWKANEFANAKNMQKQKELMTARSKGQEAFMYSDNVSAVKDGMVQNTEDINYDLQLKSDWDKSGEALTGGLVNSFLQAKRSDFAKARGTRGFSAEEFAEYIQKSGIDEQMINQLASDPNVVASFDNLSKDFGRVHEAGINGYGLRDGETKEMAISNFLKGKLMQKLNTQYKYGMARRPVEGAGGSGSTIITPPSESKNNLNTTYTINQENAIKEVGNLKKSLGLTALNYSTKEATDNNYNQEIAEKEKLIQEITSNESYYVDGKLTTGPKGQVESAQASINNLKNKQSTSDAIIKLYGKEIKEADEFIQNQIFSNSTTAYVKQEVRKRLKATKDKHFNTKSGQASTGYPVGINEVNEAYKKLKDIETIRSNFKAFKTNNKELMNVAMRYAGIENNKWNSATPLQRRKAYDQAIKWKEEDFIANRKIGSQGVVYNASPRIKSFGNSVVGTMFQNASDFNFEKGSKTSFNVTGKDSTTGNDMDFSGYSFDEKGPVTLDATKGKLKLTLKPDAGSGNDKAKGVLTIDFRDMEAYPKLQSVAYLSGELGRMLPKTGNAGYGTIKLNNTDGNPIPYYEGNKLYYLEEAEVTNDSSNLRGVRTLQLRGHYADGSPWASSITGKPKDIQTEFNRDYSNKIMEELIQAQ